MTDKYNPTNHAALNKRAENEAQDLLRNIDANDADEVYVAMVKHLTVYVGLAKYRELPIEMQQGMIERLNDLVQVFGTPMGKAPDA